MAFATAGFGATTGPITATLIRIGTGEVGASYDASGNLVVTRATASTYTPARFDAMRLVSGATPLAGLLTGAYDVTAADCGMFVSASAGGVVFAANTQGLPANFGPGRGKWALRDVARVRVEVRPRITVAAAATGVGTGIDVDVRLASADLTISLRCHLEEPIDAMDVIISYVQSTLG